MDTRYKIDGRKLSRAREKKYNQSEMAYVCGWSPSYQWQLENDRIDTISESTKKVIEEALNVYSR